LGGTIADWQALGSSVARNGLAGTGGSPTCAVSATFCASTIPDQRFHLVVAEYLNRLPPREDFKYLSSPNEISFTKVDVGDGGRARVPLSLTPDIFVRFL
jgi:hypothetical protein